MIIMKLKKIYSAKISDDLFEFILMISLKPLSPFDSKDLKFILGNYF